MSALAALYLGGIVNPITNLRHFPIAVVNEDAGPWGAKIVEGLVHQADKNAYDMRVLSHDEARWFFATQHYRAKLRDVAEHVSFENPLV